MTQEQKAKAYDDALEIARQIHNGNPSSGTAIVVCEQIFPQLRESEDERMRKLIIDRVRSAEEMTEGLRELLLSYLEKQKEHKTPVDVDPCDASWDAYYQRGLNKGYELGLDAGRKEQKPADVDESTKRLNENWMKQYFDEPKPAWSEEDEKIMQTMIKEGDLKPSEIAWLKSLRPNKQD